MDVQAIHFFLRVTARITFLFFLGAFTAPALFALWPTPGIRWIEERRRGWVLAFAASHTAHLALIVMLARKLGGTAFLHQFTWVAVVVGGAVYLFIYALAAAAAFPVNLRGVLSPRFLTFAYYPVWFVFALSYVGGTVHSVFYLPFATAAIAALALRLVAAGRARRAGAFTIASR